MRVVAYLRVSTDVQAEKGLGLSAQRAAIRAWANQHGHRVALWTSDEGVSGSNGLETRAGLAEALSAIRGDRATALVVYRLDRLARDLVVQESLLADMGRARIRVFSTSAGEDAYLDPEGAADDPSRALIRQVLGAVNGYERAMIRLRMSAGKKAKAAQGGYVGGGVRLGLRAHDGELIEDEAEQAAVRRIVELRSEGLSLREICAQLVAETVPTKRGGRWQPNTVRLVLNAQNSARPTANA